MPLQNRADLWGKLQAVPMRGSLMDIVQVELSLTAITHLCKVPRANRPATYFSSSVT